MQLVVFSAGDIYGSAYCSPNCATAQSHVQPYSATVAIHLELKLLILLFVIGKSFISFLPPGKPCHVTYLVFAISPYPRTRTADMVTKISQKIANFSTGLRNRPILLPQEAAITFTFDFPRYCSEIVYGRLLALLS